MMRNLKTKRAMLTMTKTKQKTTAAFVQTKEIFKMNLNFVFQEFHF